MKASWIAERLRSSSSWPRPNPARTAGGSAVAEAKTERGTITLREPPRSSEAGRRARLVRRANIGKTVKARAREYTQCKKLIAALNALKIADLKMKTPTSTSISCRANRLITSCPRSRLPGHQFFSVLVLDKDTTGLAQRGRSSIRP